MNFSKNNANNKNKTKRKEITKMPFQNRLRVVVRVSDHDAELINQEFDQLCEELNLNDDSFSSCSNLNENDLKEEIEKLCNVMMESKKLKKKKGNSNFNSNRIDNEIVNQSDCNDNVAIVPLEMNSGKVSPLNVTLHSQEDGNENENSINDTRGSKREKRIKINNTERKTTFKITEFTFKLTELIPNWQHVNGARLVDNPWKLKRLKNQLEWIKMQGGNKPFMLKTFKKSKKCIMEEI